MSKVRVTNYLFMQKIKPFICSLFVVFFLACQNTGKEGSASENAGEDLAEVNNAGGDSFWEDFDFSDLDAVKNPDIGEQKLVDFIYSISEYDSNQRKSAIDNMLEGAYREKESYKHFLSLFNHYLYNPNSPMQSDVIYESVLEFATSHPLGEDAEDFRNKELYELVKKNQPGQIAENFSALLPNGKVLNLSDIKSKYTLLFFYEPGCQYCEEVIQNYRSHPSINQLIEGEKLTVFAIYPYGELAAWEAYQNQLPNGWVNGIDKEMKIIKSKLYDIKATPTIYLLDEDKKVIYKDVDAEHVLYVLEEM